MARARRQAPRSPDGRRGETEADLQTPFNIKLLTGGQITDGVSWSARRNVRLLGEAAWDFELEQARFTTGVVTAF